MVLLSLSACKSSKSKSQPPTSPGGGVPLAGHSSNGLNLGLRDGSSWQVQPVGQGKVLRWLPGDPILVQRITHPVFPFQLINQRTHQATLARFTGRANNGR